MARGAFCISIDLELAWGNWDRPSTAFHRLCAEKERMVVRLLLELFATREVSTTWAIVGRLLDPSRRPPAQSEPGEGIWYAPDVVERVREARPRHDIGSHGFEHLYFHELGRERVRADLQAARRVHAEHGLDFTSFVFPRNDVSHVELLAEVGLRVFRGADLGWHAVAREKLGSLPGRAANLLDKVVPVPPAVVRPIPHPAGLVELPSSMLLLSRQGLRRLVRPEAAAAKAKLGLRRAARTGRIFHLWFHPSNFYWGTDVQLRVLEDILDTACTLRDRGEIDIRNMASFAPAPPWQDVPRERPYAAQDESRAGM